MITAREIMSESVTTISPDCSIRDAIDQLLQGRTAVVIAHRLSTIMQADKILVLYQGSIVEQGSHQELVDRQGMYYQLVQKQMSGAA